MREGEGEEEEEKDGGRLTSWSMDSCGTSTSMYLTDESFFLSSN